MAFDNIKTRKKKRIKNKLDVDKIYLGQEPVLEIVENGKDRGYSKALNWYNYFYTKKDARKLIEGYVKGNRSKEDYRAIRNCSDKYLNSTAAWICRMLENGTSMHEDGMDFLNSRIDEMVGNNTKREDDEESDDKVKAPKSISPMEKVKRKNREILCFLEKVQDEFFEEYKTDFVLYDYLIAQSANPMLLNSIKQRVQVLLEELKEYPEDFGSKKQYDAQIAFFEGWAEDIDRMQGNKKIVRKARKPKAISNEKLVKGIKYQTSFDPLKLVSLHPTELVGASQVWVYDTKYKSLQRYVAKDGEALSVKGGAIINFDDVETMGKNLRKPEEVLALVLKAGKVEMRSIMKNINTKDYKVNGRMGDNKMILKVVK